MIWFSLVMHRARGVLLMADLEGSLLPPKPESAINLRDASYPPSASGRQPFRGVDVLGLNECGQDLRFVDSC
ncbi:hypothetical protein DKX38_024656 [Salix brachista]|uniref:Uncharacterized protein n=1 Tax=Salix brachista TaxID=2182728 RepID=A0A5N5JZP9_9ROSI|nr:hypothetical protein DKX38_024656 [Salix brachista]